MNLAALRRWSGRNIKLACAAAWFAGLAAIAAPAAPQAKSVGQATYPQTLDSPAAFDRASRLEILAYAQAVGAVAPDDKPPASASNVGHWRSWMLGILRENYAQALRGCSGASDLLCAEIPATAEQFAVLAAGFNQKLPRGLGDWYEKARPFYAEHVDSERNLAAYFSLVATEIGTFNEHETNGADLPDKTFLLSFDDGPTAAGGDTDKLIALLHARDLHALFFLLGNMLDQRRATTSDQALRALYAGQCPASHGRVHLSHASMPDWQDSIASMHAKLQQIFPAAPSTALFRPPFGRRLPQTAAFVQQFGGHVVLWNIDSRDWDADMPAAAVPGRVQALMLAWRRGILLFHDVQPKAQSALPKILDATAGSDIRWLDCHDLH